MPRRPCMCITIMGRGFEHNCILIMRTAHGPPDRDCSTLETRHHSTVVGLQAPRETRYDRLDTAPYVHQHLSYIILHCILGITQNHLCLDAAVSSGERSIIPGRQGIHNGVLGISRHLDRTGNNAVAFGDRRVVAGSDGVLDFLTGRLIGLQSRGDANQFSMFIGWGRKGER